MSRPVRSNLSLDERADLIVIAEPDLPELAHFIAAQSGAVAEAVRDHLQWFLLENPARDREVPLGWGLRSGSGELVGCILCVPQNFRFQDQILTLMGSSSFYVDVMHRGGGGLIFLKFSSLGARWVLFGNSANSDAASLWKARGAVPIPHSDHELFGVLNWAPILEEILARKVGQGALSRLGGGITAPLLRVRRVKLNIVESVDLFPLDSPEQVMDLPVNKQTEKLTAARDLAYIRWRYYSGRDSTVAVFAARNKRFKSEVLVAVNQRRRGHREQIRTLNLLDIYPEVSPENCTAIVGTLLARYRGSFDAFVVRCQDSDHQQAFQRVGFVRRPLDAPNGWSLDKAGLLPTRSWYFVPADGDWSI